MTRKDWFYVPLPSEMMDSLNDILAREGKKYGIIRRTDLIRIIIGDFIKYYDQSCRLKFHRDTERMLKPFELKEGGEEEEDKEKEEKNTKQIVK